MTIDSVIFIEVSSGKVFIMMEVRLNSLFKKPEEYEILERRVQYSRNIDNFM